MRSPLALAAVLSLAAPIHAGAETVPNVTGEWSGKGVVQKNDTSRPINVRCEVEGSQTDARIGFAGECRALLVMKRAISADVNRQGEDWRGTYIGSLAGDATIVGGPQGDGAFVFDMTFPREVNGDTSAVMRIETEGDDAFTITTTDTMESGVEVTTAKIDFTRSTPND